MRKLCFLLSLMIFIYHFPSFSQQYLKSHADYHDFEYSVTEKLQSELAAEESINGKFYLDLSSIYVTPDGIFLNFDGQFFPIFNLASDENGFYTYVAGWTPCFDDDWKCVNGHWNPSYENKCVTCRKENNPTPLVGKMINHIRNGRILLWSK